MVDVKAWSGKEKAFFSNMFGKDSKWTPDHDADPSNWKPHTKQDNSEPVRNATAGDKNAEKPSIDGAVEILDGDPTPAKDKSAPSKKVNEESIMNCDECSGDDLCEDCKAKMSNIKEAFHAGKFKLDDGSHVEISENDAKMMNGASKRASGTKMMKVAKKSLKEFNAMLEFVRTISEEQIDEVSSHRMSKYVERAATDHSMSNFARRQTENVPGKEDEAKYWARKESNRKKGISRAIDGIDKKEAPASPLGQFKKK